MKIDIDGFWSFVKKYYSLFGVIFILFGGVLTFYGSKIIKTVVVLSVGTISMSLVGTLLYKYLMPDNPEEWMNWTALALLVAIGIGLGLLFVKLIKAGVFIVGAMGGVIPGLMLYQAFIYRIQPDSQVL